MFADRSGEIGTRRSAAPSASACLRGEVGGLSELSTAEPAGGLPIAIARARRRSGALPIGIAGRGFDGNLTSDSTRTDGYVLSTDIAPTILERLRVAVPDEMSGQPIRAEGARRPGGDRALGDRMAVISGPARARADRAVSRSGPGRALVAGRVAAAGAGAAAAWLAAWRRLPAAGAAGRRGARAERRSPKRLLVGARGGRPGGADPAASLGGYRALAVACGADRRRLRDRRDRRLAADVALAARAEPGARRALLRDRQRARGAAWRCSSSSAPGRRWRVRGCGSGASRRAAVAAFVAAACSPRFVFAAGRFGADVGAAIVLPVGAAVAAAIARRFRRPTRQRTTSAWLLAVVAAPRRRGPARPDRPGLAAATPT